ncbi:hypothetical protein [Flavobacterium sp. PLA-1-15]
MNADDIFGVLLLFISALGALLFMISSFKKEIMASKIKSNIILRKIRNR